MKVTTKEMLRFSEVMMNSTNQVFPPAQKVRFFQIVRTDLCTYASKNINTQYVCNSFLDNNIQYIENIKKYPRHVFVTKRVENISLIAPSFLTAILHRGLRNFFFNYFFILSRSHFGFLPNFFLCMSLNLIIIFHCFIRRGQRCIQR